MNNPIHNSNVVFRCPQELKSRMRVFAEASGQRLSSFIRSACVEVMRREASTTPQLREPSL